MQVKTLKTSKNIELPTGEKVKREAEYRFRVPESSEDAQTLFNGDLWKWAAMGYKAYIRTMASNALLGGSGDKEVSKLLRQFRQAQKTLVEIMGMSDSDAAETLLGKATFAPLTSYFEAAGQGATLHLDYTSEFPTPRAFGGGDEDEDEDGDGDED